MVYIDAGEKKKTEEEKTSNELHLSSILDGPLSHPSKMTCTLCGKQLVKLKRHLTNSHGLQDDDLHVTYNKAREALLGSTLFICSLCGKGVKHMRSHLLGTHKLVDGSVRYKQALGSLPEYTRSLKLSLRTKLKEKQRAKNTIPVSLGEWVKYECRGGIKVDSAGMKRAIKQIRNILMDKSLTLIDLVSHATTVSTYEVLYQSLLDKKYKNSSIAVMFGHLKKFIDWAASESQVECCARSVLEHAHYTRLCRKRAAPETIERKNDEYQPTIKELEPLILARNHKHIIQGMLKDAKETIKSYGTDIVHAIMAWPFLVNCGARTGVIMNMLTSEVMQATQLEEGVIIRVKNHKTCDYYGAYQVTVKPREYKIMVNYINSRVISSQYVFCTKSGSQSSYANVARFLKVLFKPIF